MGHAMGVVRDFRACFLGSIAWTSLAFFDHRGQEHSRVALPLASVRGYLLGLRSIISWLPSEQSDCLDVDFFEL